MTIYKKTLLLFVLLFGSIYCLLALHQSRNLFLDTCLVGLIALILSTHSRLHTWVLSPLMVIAALILPIELAYGNINGLFIQALWATNVSEARQFLQTLSYQSVLYSFFALFCFFIFSHLKKQAPFIGLQEYRIYLLALAILLAIHQTPLSSLKKIILSVYYSHQEAENWLQPSTWQVTQSASASAQYADFVIVIGESARPDYFQIYGYPYPNTPFLNSVNGTFVSGLKSIAPYTIGSISTMLTQSHADTYQANPARNFIDLANKAGFKTHWISNQGINGQHDSVIANIALQSQYYYFLKSSDFHSDPQSDLNLLPVFQQKLQEPSTQKRLFILHTMGSHANVCKQIAEFPINPNTPEAYKQLACYIRSIEQTDHLLKHTYASLKNHFETTQRSFSMIYFSDHGQTGKWSENKIKFAHDAQYQQQYDIPLLKLASDDTQQHKINAEKNAILMTNGLATWLGIQHAQIPAYDLFDEHSQHSKFTDDGNTLQERSALLDNPVLLLPNHLQQTIAQ